MYYIGLDIGGTSLKLGIFNEKGELQMHFNEVLELNEKPETALQKISKHLDMIDNGPNTFGAMGIGVPGILDKKEGRIIESSNLKDWIGFPLRSYFEHTHQIPVILDNDANAAALGEFHAGAGRKSKNMLMLTIGTGVGGAIILDGELFEPNGFSAEIGHMIIDVKGAECYCGHRGCLETFAGRKGIERLLGERLARIHPELAMLPDLSQLSPHMLSELAMQGNHTAREIFQISGKALGVAIANVLNIIRVEQVVLGGGIAQAWPGFFQAIQEAMMANTFNPSGIRLSHASLNEKAGIVGAANLAIRHHGTTSGIPHPKMQLV